MNTTDEGAAGYDGTDSEVSAEPTATLDPSPKRRWTILALAAVVIFSIFLRRGIVSMPLERDEGEYAYIASRWLAGDVPYRDAFDQKTPGVFAAYALLFATGLRSVEAIHWLGHAALVSTVLVLYSLGRRLFTRQVGWIAGLFTVVIVMSANLLGNAANTEVFAILPLTAGLYFAVRASESGQIWHTILTGVCGGLALMCKQVTLPTVAFSFVWVLYYCGRARLPVSSCVTGPAVRTTASDTGLVVSRLFAVGSLLTGLCLVVIPVCAYFVMQGAWAAFFDSVAGHNMAYAVRVPLRYYGSNFWDTSRLMYVVFAPMLAAAIYAGYLLFQRGGTSARFCAWWLLTAFISTSAGGYYRSHYFVFLVPPLAIVAAYGMEAIATTLEPKRRSSRYWISAGLAIAAAIWPLYLHRHYFWSPSLEFVCRHLYGRNPFPESMALANLIRENSDPEDRVFICGSEPQILFYAERASSSRYLFVYPLFADASSIARQEEVMEELRRRPPKFVLLVEPTGVPTSFSLVPTSPRYIFDALSQLINEEYTPFAASTLSSFGTTRLVLPDYNESGQPEFKFANEETVTIRIFKRRAGPDSQQPERNSENDMKSEQSLLKKNLDDVRARIEHAARVSGRTADAVRLVAVTKTVEIPIISMLSELGVMDLAESRPQELWRKHDLVPGPVRWHLVGPLQKNKARRTLSMTHLIHSVDSAALLDRLDQLAAELDVWPAVLFEVNVSGETAKHGLSPSELPDVISGTSHLTRLHIRGLMTMAPHDEDPESTRPVFAALREMRDQLAPNAPARCQLTELSMGMSNDFEVAVEEGATIVRIGSALFHGIGDRA